MNFGVFTPNTKIYFLRKRRCFNIEVFVSKHTLHLFSDSFLEIAPKNTISTGRRNDSNYSKMWSYLSLECLGVLFSCHNMKVVIDRLT